MRLAAYVKLREELCPLAIFLAFVAAVFWLPFMRAGGFADGLTFWAFLCTAVISTVGAAACGIGWLVVELRWARSKKDAAQRLRER
jgi:hypothetical protein